MFFKFGLVAVLALFALVGQTRAQDGCVAQPVNALSISANHELTWVVRADEPCEITEFLVHVWAVDGPDEYTFSVLFSRVDLNFLEACREWVFVVEPISHHTRGRSQRIVSKLPVPSGGDLSIAYVNVTNYNDTGRTHLHWAMTDQQYENCSLQYRITIEENGDPTINDIYTTNTSLDLYFLAPCTTYQFSVRAINIGRPTIEGPLRLAFDRVPPHIQGPPTITFLEQGSRYANLTFRLESKVRNPCPVTELYIGSEHFERTITIDDNSFRRQVINVSITALQPDSMYFFQTYVRNSAGWSTPNVAAFQTLEEAD